MTIKKAAKKTSPKKSAADIVDQQLARYRDMRHFDITAEPSGSKKDIAKTKQKTALPFVIQKHAASHLHYDFRLGWNGVLKSWAVAKGPSYVVKDRRLAVEVEDHPLEYGGFEGIIPKGQYGGGTVMVWDQGTWNPQPGHEDVDEGLRNGSLKFELHGTKLKGRWTLIRMNSKPGDKGGRWGSSSKPNWLLIKEHDDFERGPDDPCITEEKPDSAVTGRSLEQIAAQEDHVWNSKETATPGQAWHRNTSEPATTRTKVQSSKLKARAQPLAIATEKKLSQKPSNAKPIAPVLKSLPREHQPEFLAPQLALEATTPPSGPNYLHELKLDGYRIQARKDGSQVQLLTRKGLDWTHRMKTIAAALARLPVKQITLDGEVVVLAPNGTSSFADLQASLNDGAKHDLIYFAFDLLHLDGHNPRNLPLRERKALVSEILTAPDAAIRFNQHIEIDGAVLFEEACKMHAEGIVSKRADAPYDSGRSSAWLKSKCLHEQEFVIAGFTPSLDGPNRIGSLLLGYYEGKKLIYAGRTGTGFTQKLKHELYTQLSKLETKSTSFERIPNEARRGVRWIAPKLVAQVRFATWTADNLVRQAAFLGLREDKPATEVTREEATIAPKPKAAKASHKTAAPLAAKSTPTAKFTHNPPGTTNHVRLTHPDKILDPESELTKQQLLDYYTAIAPRILPHIANRPLSLVRCPEGVTKPCFFQKHVNQMLPRTIGSVTITDKKSGKPEPYITLNTAEAFISLAQLGVLELHPWGSCNENLEHPDRLILDLDPDAAISWSSLCEAAADVRSRLKKLGLASFLKLTGGKGLHIVAPLTPKLTWTELKEAAHDFVLDMERANPRLYLTKMTKSARANKIYLDYLRNERGATAVAPWSPRARPGANVSVPLPWSALKLPERPLYAVRDFQTWLPKLRTDPWKTLPSLRQSL